MKKIIASLVFTMLSVSYAQSDVNRHLIRQDNLVADYEITHVSLSVSGQNIIEGTISYYDLNDSKLSASNQLIEESLIEEDFSVLVTAKKPTVTVGKDLIFVQAEYRTKKLNIPTRLEDSHREFDTVDVPEITLKISSPGGILLIEEDFSEQAN